MILPRRLLTEIAAEAGFDLAGAGPAGPGTDGPRFAAWIAAGRHGSMGYLERNLGRILDPTRLLPGARTVVSVGFAYDSGPIHLPGGGRVARYAAGRDYHRVLGARLRVLARGLVRAGLPASGLRAGVDAVPILERALAARAGVGFLAKSAGIISAGRGPWLLLAEVLTTADLPGSGPAPGSCGTCTACLEACPTGAILAPFEVDAGRCLSYTTIELRGPIPRQLRAPQGDWVFGCDICIEVCPFTSRSRPRRDDPDLRPHRVVETRNLAAVLTLTEAEWRTVYTGTAMRRAGRDGLRRNAAIVLGNRGHEAATPALVAALDDPDAGLRTAAAWALARLGRGRAALSRAVDREEDPAVRADIEASLAAT